MRARHLIMLAIVALVGLIGLPASASAAPAPVIFVLIDGFRADYLDRGETPTLAALAAGGVHAKAMRPSFPSVSAPNHATLVTGLRPDKHGLVNNQFEDPLMPGMMFGSETGGPGTNDSDPRWWAEVKPIWVTAEQQGVRTAPLFYAGSSIPLHGVRGSAWLDLPRTLKPDQRVDAVLARLDLPQDKRPQFITLYFGDVDNAGHFFGPDSPELTASLHLIDAAMRRLVEGLKARGDRGDANLIVVADHGMAALSRDRIAYVEDYVAADAVRIIGGPFTRLIPAAGRQAEVEAKMLGPRNGFTCYRKAEIPERLHFGAHRRVVAPVFCVADVGWMLLSRTQEHSPLANMKGMHGWDPDAPEMAALFIANGPAFRKGVTVPDFDNVDVYPLLAKLIGVKPEPNDGDITHLAAGLVD